MLDEKLSKENSTEPFQQNDNQPNKRYCFFHRDHQQLNSTHHQFKYLIAPETTQSTMLCELTSRCLTDETCKILVKLKGENNQSPMYSSKQNAFYHMDKNSELTFSYHCNGAQLEMAMKDISTRLPNYELSQLWDKFYMQANELSYITTLSGVTTGLSLLAQDIALSFGYSNLISSRIGLGVQYSFMLGNAVYQGAGVAKMLMPFVISQSVYLGLKWLGVQDRTSKVASIAVHYTINIATGGLWQMGCHFFASTVGARAGQWIEERVSERLLSNKQNVLSI